MHLHTRVFLSVHCKHSIDCVSTLLMTVLHGHVVLSSSVIFDQLFLTSVLSSIQRSLTTKEFYSAEDSQCTVVTAVDAHHRRCRSYCTTNTNICSTNIIFSKVTRSTNITSLLWSSPQCRYCWPTHTSTILVTLFINN